MTQGINREDAKESVGPGWAGLIDKLYDRMTDDIYVMQVKEKWGGLRFYIGSATEEIFDFIDEVEKESYTICEECGQLGRLRDDLSWWITLCDAHYQASLKRRNDAIHT